MTTIQTDIFITLTSIKHCNISNNSTVTNTISLLLSKTFSHLLQKKKNFLNPYILLSTPPILISRASTRKRRKISIAIHEKESVHRRGEKAKSRSSRKSRFARAQCDGRVPLISVMHTRVYTCAGRLISADKTSLFEREAREKRGRFVV